MSNCSFNSTEFSSWIYYTYTYANGSTIYCHDDFDEQCNATLPGDPDIGGYGVLISYTVIAAVTTAVSLTQSCILMDWSNALVGWLTARQPTTDYNDSDASLVASWRLWMYDCADAFMYPLCTAQLFAGFSILVSGLVEMNRLSLYHLVLVVIYWVLTVNSLTQMLPTGSYDKTLTLVLDTELRAQLSRRNSRRKLSSQTYLQRLLALASLIMAAYFLWVSNDIMQNVWDPLTSGRCYRYLNVDPISCQWLWVTMLIMSMLVILQSLLPWTRDWCDKVDLLPSSVERRMVSTCRSHYELLAECYYSSLSQGHSNASQSNVRPPADITTGTQMLFRLAALTSTVVAVILMWSIRQFCGFIGLPGGTDPVITAINLVMFVLLVAEGVAIKILNRNLVEDESTMGFGQVVPLVLLLTLLFIGLQSVDTATKNAKKRRDLNNEKEVVVALTSASSSASSGTTPAPTVLYARPFFGLKLYRAAREVEARLNSPV